MLTTVDMNTLHGVWRRIHLYEQDDARPLSEINLAGVTQIEIVRRTKAAESSWPTAWRIFKNTFAGE